MEEAIGIYVFLTDTPGIGGRLRKDPEDFVVEEIPSEITRDEGGEYTIAKVKSRNWETNRLVRKFARTLRISRRRIRFAGTKDKRAITTQYFQFEHPAEGISSLSLPDVDIVDIFETNEKLEIGNLMGNRFKVAIRDIEKPIESAYETSMEVKEKVLDLGGFPNFFGIQRFGAVRPVTHLVGKHIVHGDFKQAVLTYTANPIEGESEEAYEARKNLQEDLDFRKALRDFPERLSFEKAILNHLVKDEQDYVGGLSQLPDNLLLMFVHAYQSFLFNKILSMRMESGLPLNEPVPGDHILPQDRRGLPDHKRPIMVTEQNLQKISTQVKNGKAHVAAVLFGRESILSEGEMGRIEREVIEEEGLRREDFLIPRMRRLSSKGTWREVLAPLHELDVKQKEDSITLEFQLNKGCYATSLLREFIKAEAMKY